MLFSELRMTFSEQVKDYSVELKTVVVVVQQSSYLTECALHFDDVNDDCCLVSWTSEEQTAIMLFSLDWYVVSSLEMNTNC